MSAHVEAAPRKLARPEAAEGCRIVWSYAISLAVYHALALLALLPWFFSWTGVALMLLGTYVFGTLGINLYYHRLLTHRGLTVAPWLGRVFAVLAVCCLQDTPAHWVAVHRRHHEHADERPDPHSPLVSFLWGHVGWMLVENDDLARLDIYRYAKDVLRDPFLRALEKTYHLILLGSWLVFLLGGFLAGLLAGETVGGAARFGLSVFVWGVAVRTVVVWHITWSVNSLSHLWGYRRYETGEDSRNNVFVALISNGEGWHNNHHADPRSARHGRGPWELDVTWLTIRALERLGLVRKVVRPAVG
jgi:stearoyl-CoA desaturase (delta-9 desaturase)